MGALTDRLNVREERLGRVLLGLTALGFVALIAAAIAIIWISGRTRSTVAAVFHTHEVRQAIAETQVALERSETARRGYLLVREPNFADGYRRAAATLPGDVARVRRLVVDNPAQTARARWIAARLATVGPLRDRSIALVNAGRIAEARALFATDASIPTIRAVRNMTRTMAQEEARLLEERLRREQRLGPIFYAIVTATFLLILLVGLLSLLVVRRSTAALAASRDTMRQLNDNLEEIVRERTADLSRANDEIQRFAYIVSHDLRSPLVNVMGFTAELDTAAGALRALVDRAEAAAPQIVDEDARLAAREDLPEAIGFIRTSTQKMDRLINAILTLSRQGRRVLAPEPLDVAALVDGIAASLAHRLAEEDARVTVVGTLPPIVADRIAVEQILSNLIENAVKYRHPDRPVVVQVHGGTVGARVWYDVRDNGRGIDPRDHQRVFDLFRRSGAQDQPGEGIGLAHVRALAYRLGGNIDLRSTLGEGSAFRLTLPHAPVDQQEPSR